MATELPRYRAIELAGIVGCDPRTAQKWARGEEVLRTYALALEAAAKRLGIELPAPKQDDAAAS